MKFAKIICCCIAVFQIGSVFSQEIDREEIIAEANRFVATANDVLVKEGNFPKAEGEYRKAIAKNPVNPTAKFNLANAYYNTQKYDEATQRYKEAVKTTDSKIEKHKAFHNQGNTFMEQKKYKEAVDAYKNALRNNSKDNETRYNLALAKKMLEQQEKENEQNKDNKDNKDQNEDQKDQKDQNKDNKDQEGDNKEDQKEGEDDKEKKEDKVGKEGEDEKDKKEELKDEGEEKKEDKKEGDGKPEEQKKQPQQVQGQLSPEQVKSLLEAMNNEEKKVQDKMNAKKAKGAKTRTEKDW